MGAVGSEGTRAERSLRAIKTRRGDRRSRSLRRSATFRRVGLPTSNSGWLPFRYAAAKSLCASLLDHTVFDRALRRHYGDADVEDLWTGYFAVATCLATNALPYSLRRSGS